MKCIACKTGNLTPSGSFLYCDNCSHSEFSMTDDYVEAATNLLATLVSNTEFKDHDTFVRFVGYLTSRHLPQLDMWLSNLTTSKVDLQILNQIKERAINLQIEEVTHNEEENLELICRCGSASFNQLEINEIECTDCKAKYVYSHDSHLYEPYFSCQCGGVNYYNADEEGMVVACGECDQLYIHSIAEKKFLKIES